MKNGLATSDTRGLVFPQLDGLRAIAVTAVALSHWAPKELQFGLPWGTGVQLFFVLSGFLITGILLRNRPDSSGTSVPDVLKSFYARRMLRIFPLYYGVIAIGLIFSVGSIHDYWQWYISYLSNILLALQGYGGPLVDPYAHFWSLAVEEQYYLIWPLVVLLASRRSVHAILWASIIGSLCFRIVMGHLWWNSDLIRYLPLSSLDALSTGGLAAYALHYTGAPGLEKIKKVFAGVGLSGLVILIAIFKITKAPEAHWIGHTFLVIFYGAIVTQAAQGFNGLVGRFLSNKVVTYFGKISYGLYVYHYFAPIAFEKMGLGPTALTFPFDICAYTAFTVITSIISWHFYESLILRLKGRFDYPQSTASPHLSINSGSASVETVDPLSRAP